MAGRTRSQYAGKQDTADPKADAEDTAAWYAETYKAYSPSDDEKKADGRLVKKPVYLTDDLGRARLYDVNDLMPFDVIKAQRVGPHVFSEDPTQGEADGFTIVGVRA